MGPCDEEHCSSYCHVISMFMHDYLSMRRHLSVSIKFHGYQELLVHWQQCFEGVQLFTRKILVLSSGRRWTHGGLLITSGIGCLAWIVLHLTGMELIFRFPFPLMFWFPFPLDRYGIVFLVPIPTDVS